MYRLPFMSFAPLGFAAAMLGAVEGAYESFRDWMRERTTVTGARAADTPSVQVRLSWVAADLDAALLLMQRAVAAAEAQEPPTVEVRARTMRDAARISSLVTVAVDELLAMSGTAGFATGKVIQRTWRDVHFASSYISLSAEINCAHWGRLELGVERPATLFMY